MHRYQGSREGSTMLRGGSRGGFQLVVERRDGGTQEVGCAGVGHGCNIYVEVIYCQGEEGKGAKLSRTQRVGADRTWASNAAVCTRPPRFTCTQIRYRPG